MKEVAAPKKITAKQGVIIFVVTIITLIGTFAFLMNSSDVDSKPWKDMTYEEKERWIKDFCHDSNEGTLKMDNMMDMKIKANFNFPKEVEFDAGKYPSTNICEVVNAETGVTFVRGSGTAKNAFGVKSAFVYDVKMIVTKDSLYIKDISVRQ